MNTEEILARLISFDSTSRNPNKDLIEFTSNLLAEAGISSQIIPDATGTKANLYATIGPTDKSGVMLSGHTDIVPVDGQNWTKPPFEMIIENNRYYGRGSTDMKGFVACAISSALKAAKLQLQIPLHLSFSYDEELGCIGVHSLIDMLAKAPMRPAFCIVGEPTNMAVATGHKGKTGLLAKCTGREGHSALAPFAMNALYLGSDLISVLREMQNELRLNSSEDEDYDVPYSTIHVGKFNGGTALNIVPNTCELAFEIRNIASDDPRKILDDLHERIRPIIIAARKTAPEANIEIEIFNTYPGLDTPENADVVQFVKSLTGANTTCKMAFGTEGGLFSEKLEIPTVVCGPGSMAQGHKPDEYVEIEQMARCETMLDNLLNRLVTEI